ncbi:MAG: PhzF family phenazine biosynthesis protein [Sphingomonas sp.]|uniref:PhzF family phenazine biosynthesis protein n=1 Tax=Sphingomonas sp. TaxID=28214 RepID=UPI00182CCEDF|nr:PhzF family phenazine biosynthesis protein [Sphingomonas sp.]MBA3666454.1 PhzF family phenazine biosynthesis protein [Sphingomonas sp.]
MNLHLVDVFAPRPLTGNGLTIVLSDRPIDDRLMQRLTIELRQFETIFLQPEAPPTTWRARVFTMEEELDFAGHPVIGAAALLHHRHYPAEPRATLKLTLNRQQVIADSERIEGGYRVTMHQAEPRWITTVAAEDEAPFLDALDLSAERRDATLPMEVVTTGLPYLIVPVDAAGLSGAQVRVDDLEQRLTRIGAKFAYLVDARGREGRTWDNLGRVEDVATGSAAGPVAAFLVRHGRAALGEEFMLSQGRLAGRPSEIVVRVGGSSGAMTGIAVTGEVRLIASGRFDPSILR